jgi:hypothetical protein
VGVIYLSCLLGWIVCEFYELFVDLVEVKFGECHSHFRKNPRKI